MPAFDVRPGYKVTLAAENFGPARFMAFDDKGTLFVSAPRAGTVTALRDTDGDGVYETKTKFISNYPDCHSMAFDDGWLYVTAAKDGSCKRAKSTKNDGVADVVETFLPPGSLPAGGGGHPFRGITLTQSHVYVTVSDPRNMTEELDSDTKTLYRFDRNGKNRTVFASGIRNTEKLQLRPGTEEVWGLDHGSDNFGKNYGETKGNQPITDVLPGEELNHFVEGGFYGHPYLSNNRIVRPEFANRKDIIELAAKTISPAWVFGAHWAGNGFTFLSKDGFPDHKGDLIAAFHGSWNSTSRVGYCVTRVLFDSVTGRPYGSLPLVTAVSKDGNVLARPVDCAEAPDGTILFSCDQTNKVFRISRAN
ncbi:MAG TPA: PQQ-dependent sugar dehydrogenase [Tepidisphaeraceae bacterium]